MKLTVLKNARFNTGLLALVVALNTITNLTTGNYVFAAIAAFATVFIVRDLKNVNELVQEELTRKGA